jgi:hypothetical protein
VLEPLIESLQEKFGFAADFSHTAIVGNCAACQAASVAGGLLGQRASPQDAAGRERSLSER